MNFRGKTAVVTGGTRGIGKAICEILWERGGNVIVTGTSINNRRFKKRQRLKYMQLDFLDPQSIDSFVKAIRKSKRIDVLINNAGINIIESIDRLKRDNWDKVLQVNLTGPMVLTKTVSSVMKKNRRGRILNISSIWGVIAKEKRI